METLRQLVKEDKKEQQGREPRVRWPYTIKKISRLRRPELIFALHQLLLMTRQGLTDNTVLFTEESCGFCAYDGDKPIGMLLFGRPDYPHGNLVAFVAVEAAYHHKKVFAALHKKALRLAYECTGVLEYLVSVNNEPMLVAMDKLGAQVKKENSRFMSCYFLDDSPNILTLKQHGKVIGRGTC